MLPSVYFIIHLTTVIALPFLSFFALLFVPLYYLVRPEKAASRVENVVGATWDMFQSHLYDLKDAIGDFWEDVRELFSSSFNSVWKKIKEFYQKRTRIPFDDVDSDDTDSDDADY